MSDERPQATYTRAVHASMAHEAMHSPSWKLPCRTCRDLREVEDRALDALRRSR